MNRFGVNCAVLLLLVSAPWCLRASAQTDDPFSISVDSNLVLVRAEVFRKGARYSRTSYSDNCFHVLDNAFKHLPMSKPFLEDVSCLKESAIDDLKPTEFHIFEDGVERTIQNVKLQREPAFTERDVRDKAISFHDMWSFTPRGIWRTPDFDPSWTPITAMYYYRIAYVPLKLEHGKCHHVRVSVDRPHTEVFATDQYCYIDHPSADPLMGTEFGKQMETELTSDTKPKIRVSAQAGFFYTDAQTAKVDVILEFPFGKLNHSWQGWLGVDLDAKIGVLGVVTTRNSSEHGRFSDSAALPGYPQWSPYHDNPDLYDVRVLPTRYETQLDVPPGDYTLRVVLSDGEKFGRIAIPLHIDSYPETQLALSSLFLNKRSRITAAAAQERKAVNLAPDYVPLVSEDIEVTPSADPTFDPKELLPAYFQVYEPLLAKHPDVKVEARLRIVDASGRLKAQYPWFDAAPYRRSGKNVFAIAKSLFLTGLANGEYRVEAQAKDSAGRTTAWRSAQFTVKKNKIPSYLF